MLLLCLCCRLALFIGLFRVRFIVFVCSRGFCVFVVLFVVCIVSVCLVFGFVRLCCEMGRELFGVFVWCVFVVCDCACVVVCFLVVAIVCFVRVGMCVLLFTCNVFVL